MRLKNYLFEEDDKITQTDLNNIERYADSLFKKIKVDVEFTKHFKDQINNKRNKKQITFTEMVSIFRRTFKKFGFKISNLPDGAEKVLADMLSDINMPFVMVWDNRNQEFDLIAKTVMRKKGFKSSNEKLRLN
jgi:hypothetical protein